MQQEYWDGNEEQVYEEVPQDLTTFIRVNGAVLPLAVGDNFESTVKEIARKSRLGKFRLYLDGAEIFPEDGDLPTSIEEGMQLEAKPFDKAG